jgi:hypothetical protein
MHAEGTATLGKDLWEFQQRHADKENILPKLYHQR